MSGCVVLRPEEKLAGKTLSARVLDRYRLPEPHNVRSQNVQALTCNGPACNQMTTISLIQ